MLTFAFMHHPYLVCIFFGMPSLHLFTFFNVFFYFLVSILFDVNLKFDVNARSKSLRLFFQVYGHGLFDFSSGLALV